MTELTKINITYDYSKDETKLKTSRNWNSLEVIHQLDSLKDAIELVKNLYNDKVIEFNKLPKQSER